MVQVHPESAVKFKYGERGFRSGELLFCWKYRPARGRSSKRRLCRVSRRKEDERRNSSGPAASISDGRNHDPSWDGIAKSTSSASVGVPPGSTLHAQANTPRMGPAG